MDVYCDESCCLASDQIRVNQESYNLARLFGSPQFLMVLPTVRLPNAHILGR